MREVAFHDLHVIEVVLQEQIVRADLVHDLDRLRRRFRKKPGMSRVLIGSISSRMPASGELRCGEAQVARRRSARTLAARHALRRDAGEAVDLLAAERAARSRCAVADAGAELARRGPGWQAMPRSPRGPVAGRQVVQRLGEPVLPQSASASCSFG